MKKSLALAGLERRRDYWTDQARDARMDLQNAADISTASEIAAGAIDAPLAALKHAISEIGRISELIELLEYIEEEQ